MTTLASDNFNRANENPLSGGGVWVPFTFGGLANALRLVSNEVGVVTASTDSWSVYDGGITWPQDQWSECKYSVAGTGDGGPIVHANTSAGNGYLANRSSGINWEIFRVSAGGFTSIASVAGSLSAGDVMRLEVTGSTTKTLVLKRNGTQILSFADTTPLAVGKPGIGLFDGTLRVDDWSAGDFAGGTVYIGPPPQQQAPVQYRSAMTPQSIVAGLAALLPLVIGPTVPQGDPAQLATAQARVAHRDPAHLGAQPKPPNVVVTALAVATGNAVPIDTAAPSQARVAYRELVNTVPQQPAPPKINVGTPAVVYAPWLPTVAAAPITPWPYVATMLPKPVSSLFGIAAIYLGNPALNHPLAPPWPHASTQPTPARITAAGAAASPYTPRPAITVPVLSQHWPYVATMLPEPSASQFGQADYDLIFDRLQPSMVQTAAWPYTLAKPTSAVPVIQAAALLVRPASAHPAVPAWPYASSQLTSTFAAQFGQAAIYLGPLPLAQPSAPVWLYAATLIEASALAPFVQTSAYLGPQNVAPPPPGAWPYAATMLPEPSTSQFSVTSIYLCPVPVQTPVAGPWPFAALQARAAAPISQPIAQALPSAVFVPTTTAWNYTLPQPVPALPIVTAAATQITPQPLAQIAQSSWPYAALQGLVDGTPALIPNLGTQIPPQPVLQWLTQPAWPFVATLLPASNAAQAAPTVVYTFSPPINTVRVPEWPYAATMVPAPVASRFGQNAIQLAPAPAFQPAQQAWPYLVTMQVFGPAAMQVVQATSNVPPSTVLQVASVPWPHAATLRPATTILPAPAASAYVWPPALFPVRAPDWSYAALQPAAPETIQPAAAQVPRSNAAPHPSPVPWTYAVAALKSTLPVPLLQGSGFIWPQPIAQPLQAAWASTEPQRKTASALVQSVLIGPQAPPRVVLQWITQPPWPYTETMRPAPVVLAQGTGWLQFGIELVTIARRRADVTIAKRPSIVEIEDRQGVVRADWEQ